MICINIRNTLRSECNSRREVGLPHDYCPLPPPSIDPEFLTSRRSNHPSRPLFPAFADVVLVCTLKVGEDISRFCHAVQQQDGSEEGQRGMRVVVGLMVSSQRERRGSSYSNGSGSDDGDGGGDSDTTSTLSRKRPSSVVQEGGDDNDPLLIVVVRGPITLAIGYSGLFTSPAVRHLEDGKR
uniref:Uncharacterized protein n=1 Tax=Oryza sativa subsp. japonica TaxID=39947 RepID=Q5VRL7_ORYSJ|nr:hypothetical protein [Oryza sativa Japonica Group]